MKLCRSEVWRGVFRTTRRTGREYKIVRKDPSNFINKTSNFHITFSISLDIHPRTSVLHNPKVLPITNSHPGPLRNHLLPNLQPDPRLSPSRSHPTGSGPHFFPILRRIRSPAPLIRNHSPRRPLARIPRCHGMCADFLLRGCYSEAMGGLCGEGKGRRA